ncbi:MULTISPECIES: class I adenylate cyclase [Pseudomonas]|uniref:class I adenylate cyclase n=1 Tax=Pseudomonas TaxID=286 RepID=UPI0008760823|nr:MULTISPECIES: class I adenylate cyclase [Pseudomonas]MDB6442049.1 class I adenylate cyclase [Pseudomonas sp. 21TX0197]MDT8908381.1 class I adenylate cyclase [Pseudomonas prosekii]NHN71129.1 class I adenylate cyclase [Pseudomonas fluorescens]SCX49771.1 adenylate cyclase, class 1 [Pseudomonas sp. NFACC32-1]SFX37797.1 adenylate cyclase, class 1 [Pseudomonas sp. NFACC49-2]
MTRNHEIRPDLDEGIDRKVLSQLRARFLKLNTIRMERALEGLSPRQQSVLTLLPLFFHVNHPLLPGYVSSTTPAGLSNYEPDASVLTEAQRLTRSFSYKPRHGSNPPRPILGLFLMGSLGTLAQADQSDMDVWVCHGPDLSDDELAELRKKCQLLEAWAATQGAEAHFFLIDPARFVRGERDNQLSSDDCGTTQHYLLLDEFYRTAIWLAGRTPIWWLVPVYEEDNYEQYTHTLISKRFIRADETLDLGHLAYIPPGEFIGAGLWQLFKGIESPYKSVLKLLLTEVYASEHPDVRCLSLRFKQAVFANRLDLEELDPYMLIYRRIEEYLKARGEPERLELIRRALYLKVNRKLTGPARSSGWQRTLLERLASEWGWDQRQLALLDSRSQWKVRQVSNERRALVNELTYSYRFLTQFARTEKTVSLINKRDLNVLGRRLYAAFERKADKVEFINPGIAPDLAEDTLTLVQSPNKKEPGQNQWGLYNGSLNALEWENFAPIKRSRELLELLTWCHRNGVIDSSTRLALHPGESDLSEFELFNLLGSLQQAIALPLATVDEERLLHASVPSEVLILVNVGIDPLKHHRDLNILMTTERTDSLSYAGVRENLVLTLDQVTLNSWNEVLVNRFDGEHALLDCLRDYLNDLPSGPRQPRLQVRCFCHNRAQFIARRVEEVIETAQTLLLSNLNHRYLLQVQQHYHVLELVPGQVNHIPLASLSALMDYLGEELAAYSPLHLDSMALEDHDLALVLPMGQPECIQVFYRVNEDDADLYVLDELNALWQQRLPYHDEQSLLVPLQRFLQSVLYRRDALLPMDAAQPLNLETLYYQLLPSGNGRARRIEARQAPQTPVNKPFYDVQAIIGKAAHGQVHVTLYCNQQEFSELEHGDQLFRVVAGEIVGQRREAERYRCYITDLDLSGLVGDGACSSNLYLRYKADLERALNEALTLV